MYAATKRRIFLYFPLFSYVIQELNRNEKIA
nr:MAG TPA: hypothetical protein [Caudoviricetes sp.]